MNRRWNLPGIASGLFSVLIGGQAFAQLNDHVPPAPAGSDAPIPPVPLLDGYSNDAHPDALDLADPPVPGYLGPVVVPGVDHGPNAWQPGGNSGRTGRPYYYTAPGRDRALYSVHNMRPTPWAIDHSSTNTTSVRDSTGIRKADLIAFPMTPTAPLGIFRVIRFTTATRIGPGELFRQFLDPKAG
jgi:hypothetical protein